MRTSKHSLKFANVDKIKHLDAIVDEYKRCAQHFIDYIWNNGYKWDDKIFLPKRKQLELPSLLTSDLITDSKLETFLTGRMLKCCITQVAGILKAETEKQRKRLFILQEKRSQGVSKKKLKPLLKNIKHNNPVKPILKNINMEINSICCDFLELEDSHFDAFIRLKSITKTKIEINLPLKHSTHSNKLKENGTRLTSFLIGKNSIDIRWDLGEFKALEEGVVIGGDQGYKDVLTTSNGNVATKTDIHGHTLESIVKKVSNRKHGSKAFKRAKQHQKNFINWSINNFDLTNVKQLNLEDIVNINYGKKSNKTLSHWQNTLIRDKIESKCEMNNIRLILQSSSYRSQRCSCCGNVRKANRKGKNYSCKNCGNIIDADLNAAKNHEYILPDVPYNLRMLKLNRKDGFLWLETGFYDLENRSLQSLYQKE